MSRVRETVTPEAAARPALDAELELCGWGRALPGPPRTQAELLRWLERHLPDHAFDAREARILFRRSGVTTRHVVVDLDDDPLFPADGRTHPPPGLARRMRRFGREAPALGARACRQALDEAGVAPSEVAHLVTVSCTGAGSPGLDVALLDALGLAPTTARTHVGFMGCHGAFNGLAVAAGLARRHPGRPLLLCPVELCSLHVGAHPEGRVQVADALFADGAAALVVRHRPAGAAGPGDGQAPWRLVDQASCLLPEGRGDLTWALGEHGFVMGLSAALPGRIAAHLPGWLGAWLDRHGLSVKDVAGWAVHPGGPRILDTVRDALGLPDAALQMSREVLAESGNMSSPTVLFILERLRRTGPARPCVALGFGPGPVAEAALFA